MSRTWSIAAAFALPLLFPAFAAATPDYEYPVAGVTTTTRLRMRAGPSISARILYTIPRARERLTVFERRGAWLRVTPDGFSPTAWVHGAYVDLKPGTGVLHRPPYLSQLAPTEVRRAPAEQEYVPPPRPEPSLTQAAIPVLSMFGGIALLGWLSYLAAKDFGDNDPGCTAAIVVFFAPIAVITFILQLVAPDAERLEPGLQLYGLVFNLVVSLPLICYGLYRLYGYIHYLVVAHPLEHEIRRAIRGAKSIDRKRVAETLKSLAESLPHEQYKRRNRQRRAERLTELLRAEEELFEAIIGRERLREIRERLRYGR